MTATDPTALSILCVRSGLRIRKVIDDSVEHRSFFGSYKLHTFSMDKDLPLRTVGFTGAGAPCITDGVLSAGCAVLRVTYVPAMAALEGESMQDALDLVIAADELVFHAIYRPAIDHRLVQEATRLRIRDHSERLVIALDRSFLQSTTQTVSGNGAAMLCGRYSAADNLMRELGNALLRDFRAGRIPAPPYLESLAGVIAVHL